MSTNMDRVGDSGDEVEDIDDEESSVPDDVSSQIMNRPDILAAFQARGHYLMMQTLPAPIKRRIKALKKLQLETTNIEAKFFEEVHRLECKYHELYSPLYAKREHIVTGIYEPNDEECDFPSDDEREIDEQLTRDFRNKIQLQDIHNEDDYGVPDFWLTIFKNVAMLSDMVQPHDEPILKQLLDVKVVFLPSEPMGFILEFHFGPNEYFSNSVLTKEYEMKCKPDETDPFSFEGPEIYKCKGCVIDWFKGKNVTVKTIKKKQKHKSRGSIRTVTKTVQNDSFFNFFSPPCVSDDQDADLDEDTQALLTSDFEIGHYIRERIVPRAVLYYTGEALDDEDDEDFDVEDDDEDDDDEEEEIIESNKPSSKSATTMKPPSKTNLNHPAECKQQ